MLTLYDAGLSPFAQKVKMVLAAKELPFERKVPDLAAPPPEFLAVSPRREVPVLVDGATAVFDSSIIVDYLEERWPQRPVLPASPAERARVRMIAALCDSQLEAIIFGMTEIIAFKRDTGPVGEGLLEKGRADLATFLAWLSEQLGDREWFNGDAYGFGDMAVLPYMQTASLYKAAPTPDSPLGRWFARARVQPGFQACIADAKAEVAAFRAAAEKVMSGQWPREYRDHRLDWIIRAGGIEMVRAGLADGTIRLSRLAGAAS